MVLVHAKDITKGYGGAYVHDAVLITPSFFTQLERQVGGVGGVDVKHPIITMESIHPSVHPLGVRHDDDDDYLPASSHLSSL